MQVDDVYARYANEEEEALRVRTFESFVPAALPAGCLRGTPNSCSVTALKVAHAYGLTPARGYALFQIPRRRLRRRSIWIGHWWAVTGTGKVVDASWEEPGLAYIGERLQCRAEPSPRSGVDLCAYSPEGVLVRDLGVYVYAPAAVAAELERRREAGD